MSTVFLFRHFGYASMTSLWTVLWALSIALIAADDSCPPDESISPCTCDSEGLGCRGAGRTLDEVRKTFRAKFPYGAVRSVWIQHTPLTSIPRDLFGSVRSQDFYIEVNNVTSVDLRAFSASKEILQTLSLFGNKLEQMDYAALGDYKDLQLLNLGLNQIASIPDNAFSSDSLHTIILRQNKISHIGMNAFANLPNLSKLEMTRNKIKTLGPLSFAMKSHSYYLEIHLSSNQISEISKSAFEGTSPYMLVLFQNKMTSLPSDVFSDLVTRMGRKRGVIQVTLNPLSCTGCDYAWIERNKDVLGDKFIGFRCKDGSSMSDLTKSSIKCD